METRTHMSPSHAEAGDVKTSDYVTDYGFRMAGWHVFSRACAYVTHRAG